MHVGRSAGRHFKSLELFKQVLRDVFADYVDYGFSMSACWYIKGLDLYDMDGGDVYACREVSRSVSRYFKGLEMVKQSWRDFFFLTLRSACWDFIGLDL